MAVEKKILINLNEDEREDFSTISSVFIDHQKLYYQENGLQLRDELFNINSPFMMNSEKRDNQKRSTYWESLSDDERKIVDKVMQSDEIKCGEIPTVNKDNNSSARRLASKVHNITSGIASLQDGLIRSNTFNKPTIFSHVFQEYLIPAMSSFYIGDAREGLNKVLSNMLKHRDNLKFEENFLIIIDPPWDCNKSVKRKKNYSTQSYVEIIEVCQTLAKLMSQIEATEYDHNNRKIRFFVHIWCTEKTKSFVLDKMLPCLGVKYLSSLLWHKVTRYGESVKLRGSKEYLIVASSQEDKSDMQLTRLIVSIPSSIHSHKPPLISNLIGTGDTSSTSEIISSSSSSFWNTCSPLTHDEYPECLRGIEIYSRYLRSGFISIGLECIRLQCKDLFTSV
ncbi:methyltransferase like 4 [Brevipalpus obovatus]|uniref:methyltransferase like 4 n=1 Tax=Brevipalpus obovatus TaxID=246614 RepID=UPI003D9F3694